MSELICAWEKKQVAISCQHDQRRLQIFARRPHLALSPLGNWDATCAAAPEAPCNAPTSSRASRIDHLGALLILFGRGRVLRVIGGVGIVCAAAVPVGRVGQRMWIETRLSCRTCLKFSYKETKQWETLAETGRNGMGAYAWERTLMLTLALLLERDTLPRRLVRRLRPLNREGAHAEAVREHGKSLVELRERARQALHDLEVLVERLDLVDEVMDREEVEPRRRGRARALASISRLMKRALRDPAERCVVDGHRTVGW